jgi:hypothetical protein
MAVIIGYNNQIESAIAISGDTDPDFPITNIQTRYHGQRARFTSTSATITLTIGSNIGALAVAGNLTRDAVLTFTCGSYASGDTGATAVAIPADVESTSATITINDPGNPDGYVAVGRVFAGPAWRPATCVDWGMRIGLESRSEVSESLGGVEFFNKRRNRRTWSGTWGWLTADEAWDGLFAIQQQSDVWGEVAFIGDDADPRRDNAFLARFKELSAVEYPYPLINAMAVNVQEMLA